jgi:hypothetical protein
MKAFALKSRILAVLGSTALGASVGAFGCGNDANTPPPGSTQTGSTGSGGMSACFTREELVQFCGPQTGCHVPSPGYCCYADSDPNDPARWPIDGGSPCPASIDTEPDYYAGPPVANDGGACCYAVHPYMATASARPFFVEGKALRAPVASRADWIAQMPDENLQLDAATRSALAAAWLEDARLEHASIASFARFTLALLAVGAPSDLVADAERAMADEVNHARLCFSLASRYAGENLGPGALVLGGTLASSSLVDAVVSTVREGCIYETLGALRASAALEHAADARVRAALATIAEDEARHAELAWRFVAWAAKTGGAAVRSAIERTFCEGLASLSNDVPSHDAHDAPAGSQAIDLEAWRTHGRLSPTEECRARVAAVRDVIAPSWRALAPAHVSLTTASMT